MYSSMVSIFTSANWIRGWTMKKLKEFRSELFEFKQNDMECFLLCVHQRYIR